MPVYNAEKYLDMSVRSVLEQTSDQWELIMVDDGSTDSSGALCDQYAAADSRITVIHKANGGSISARIAAIKITKNEFCIFLDSDDFLAPHCVERVLQILQESDADIVMYGFQQYENGKFGERHPVASEEQSIPVDHFRRTLAISAEYNSLWTKAIRTTYLNEAPWMKQTITLNIGEDKLMLLHPATRAKNIVAIPDVLYFYRINADSLMHTFSGKILKERIGLELADITYAYVRRWNMNTPDVVEGMSTLLWQNMVGVANLMLFDKCSNGAKQELKEMKIKKSIPPYIIHYVKCHKLSYKDKVKLFWFTLMYG